MRPSVLPLLKVSHDTVHNMRLRREQIDGFDIVVRRSSVGDLLDVWAKSEVETSCTETRILLVMLSFRMVSWSSTLSSNRLESGSTTSTFQSLRVIWRIVLRRTGLGQ